MGKSTKDARDHFYRQGKRDGYRARSAYKLIHLDEQYALFGRGQRALGAEADDAFYKALGAELGAEARSALRAENRQPLCVLDLCAAPGSWSQVLSRTLGPAGARIVAVDLQAMAPVQGVRQVVGDITTEATAQAVEQAMRAGNTTKPSAPAEADLIVCDGAPDVTGVQHLDEYVQSQLLLAAVTMALRTLRTGGTFVAKVFVHEHTESARLLRAQLERLFTHVEYAKPASSRASSAEHFVVCLGLERREASIETVQHSFLGDLAGYNAPIDAN